MPSRPVVLPSAAEERPAWVDEVIEVVHDGVQALQEQGRCDELLEALHKQARAGAKQALRLETSLSEIAAQPTKRGSASGAPAGAASKGA